MAAEDIELISDGYRTDGSGKEAVHGVECVGRISFLLEHPILEALALKDESKYGALKGGVYLTGFKLEDVAIRTSGMIANAKFSGKESLYCIIALTALLRDPSPPTITIVSYPFTHIIFVNLSTEPDASD